MDISNFSNKISDTTRCVIACFFFCISLTPSSSYAQSSDEIAATSSSIETPFSESDENLIDDDDSVGYLTGCAGGAIAGSIVPGIGTLLGALVGCATAYIW